MTDRGCCNKLVVHYRFPQPQKTHVRSPAPGSSPVPAVSLCPAAKTHPGAEEQGKHQGKIQGGKAGGEGSYGGHPGAGRGCHVPTGAGKSEAGSRQTQSSRGQPGKQLSTQRAENLDGRTAFLSQTRMGGEAEAPPFVPQLPRGARQASA